MTRETAESDDRLAAFCPGPRLRLAGTPGGPLTGTTFAVKDSFDVAGHRTGNGQPTWRASHAPAAETAWAVQRLLDGGADLAGKTQCDELQYSLNGENVHYGTPSNPAAPGRIPGGSSSGSASAVAGGAVDVALGTDCGGSVRLPASYCGILGFRPSHGRIPATGGVPLAAGFDTVGWFAREPALFRRVGEVLLDDPSPARAFDRVIVAEDAFTLAGDEVRKALATAVAALDAPGRQVAAGAVAEGDFTPWVQAFRILQGAEIWATHGDWIEQYRPELGPGIRERIAFAAEIDADQVALAGQVRARVKARHGALLAGDTVICLPTSPGAAPRLATPTDQLEAFRYRAFSLLCIAGLCGLPQVSLPLGRLADGPIGLSLIAPPGRDTDLLALAEELMASVAA